MTRLLAYAAEALDAVWRNRTRSILTMLGMIIGTGSVIAVLGISSAASSGIAGSLESFGDPGYQILVDPRQDDPNSAQIQYRDVATVASENAGIFKYVFPVYDRHYHVRANGVDYFAEVFGGNGYINDTLTLHEGRRIRGPELDGAEHVTLLSQSMSRRYFGEGSALGRTVRVNGVRFTVIGVYDELKSSFFNNANGSDFVEIPNSTFHELAPGPIDGLQVYAAPGIGADRVRVAVVDSLRHVHGPRATYIVQDVQSFIQAFNTVIKVVSLGLTAIGGVALLVAGIGIMNIMLVSIAERTREIGIRKAIGGSRNDIALQFLLESVILSLLGGGVGTLFGLGAVLLIASAVSALLGPAPIPYLQIVGVAAGFSVVVGVLFGTYPALRAARLDPIEALRT